MFCRNCGTQMNDDAAFCPVCGTQTAGAQQQEAYVQNDYTQQAAYTQTDYTQQAAYAQDDSAFYQQPEDGGKKKGKKLGKKGTIIIAAVAVVLVGAIVFGFMAPGLTNLSTMLGMSSQMNEVFEAAKNTVFDSKNMTVTLTQKTSNSYYDDWDERDYSYSNKLEVACYVEFGDDVDSTIAFVEGTRKYENSYGEKDTTSVKYGLLEGELYSSDYGKADVTASDVLERAEDNISYYGKIDLEDTINEILNGKIDEKSVEDIFDTLIRDLIENAIDEELDASIEVPTYDECMKIFKRFFVKGLSKDAVTFEKNGDKYEYTIDVGTFLEDFANFAEEDKVVSAYVEEIADAVDEDPDDFYDNIRDEADYFSDEDIEISGEIMVKGNKLTYISVVEKDGNYTSITELSFTDINKTTVDPDDIKKLGK